jgi:BirA family biotin operon repressor/biotin-[acetyl-CoA-carboxylase] ligase
LRGGNERYENNGLAYKIRRRFHERGARLKKTAAAEGVGVKINGAEVMLYRRVSSTNTVMKELAASGLKDGSIIWSQYQSQGRGRMRRKWDGKPGRALLFSMLVKAAGLEARYAPLYTLFTAAVLAEAVKNVTGLRVGIKWPNDIVVGGRKLCGILSESNLYSGGKVNYLVIGIGLNVNQKARDFPSEIRPASTSLNIETRRHISRVKILKAFLRAWRRRTECLKKNGLSYIVEIWKKYDITLGREVEVINGERWLKGRAVDIGALGELIIETLDGNRVKCLAEDISLGKYYYGKG